MWRRKGVGFNEEGGRDSEDDQRGNGAGEASAWMMEGGKRGVGLVTARERGCEFWFRFIFSRIEILKKGLCFFGCDIGRADFWPTP